MNEANTKPQQSIAMIILNFVSGYGLALITLTILGLLVWFSTLEQVIYGLSDTSRRYYSSENFFVTTRPEATGIMLILPSAYWTCVILFINMFLGGILRIRKGIKQIGPIISHFGILLLLVVGVVDHHQSIHGRMDTRQYGTYDYAWKQDKTSIEVFQYDKDQNKTKPYVIHHEFLEDLAGDAGNANYRVFTFKDLPFDIEIRRFFENAELMKDNGSVTTPSNPVVDGFYLREVPIDPKIDLYFYGCYATIKPKDGSPSSTRIISRNINHPVTFTVSNTLYGIEMPNEIWHMPYEVDLVSSRGEYYPGTQRASHFSSKIIWKDDGDREKHSTIKMNEPLRYKGYTLYQANWTPPTNGIQYSGFEIVTNPADGWPLGCLLISAFGLIVHFLMKFYQFLDRESRKVAK